MGRIMTGVILALAVLVFSNCAAIGDGHMRRTLMEGQNIRIEIRDNETKKVEVIEFRFKGLDEDGNPIVVDENCKEWGSLMKELPEGAEEIFSLHYVNPPCIRINGVPRCR